MSEDNKPFTVSDRRHFTADGGVREESAPSAPTDDPSAHGDEDVVDFAGFLMSLGIQAQTLLAEASKPGAEAKKALKGARSVISILEMLETKTEGHRDESEDRILNGLLYELRMGYVATARAVGA